MIIEASKNCWRVERADRFSCIQDGADYFRLVRNALLAARHTVFILGWDINAHLNLLPGTHAADAPTRLDKLLVYIARRRPELRCYILIWDYGSLYTLERDPLSRWRLGWRTPRGIKFGFDDHCPVGASHHQKIVVVDDQLGFCGGVDLTGHRWDTSEHRPEDPLRTNAFGAAYGPYHEIQAMVTGPAAAALGELARERWRVHGAERLKPALPSTSDLWPSDVAPDLTGVSVGISRTMPASETRPAVRECEALFLESIAQAKRTIYIESQYFTSATLTGPLADRLEEPDGPEIIVVAPRVCHGWLEQNTMGAFRGEVFRQLKAADAHNRLRLVYPLASRAHDLPTFVHSKVMVVDDVLARIGSANFSERSLGVDTECDLAAEAGDDPIARSGVLRIRDRLLAEHLGLSVDVVTREIAGRGSIAALIDARAGAERALMPIDTEHTAELPPAPVRTAADPAEPLAFGPAVDSLVPRVDATSAASPLRVWILPLVAIAAAAAVAWPVPDLLEGLPRALPVWSGAALFVVAGLMLVPIELLAIAAGVLFGAVHGGLVTLVGSLAGVVIGYVAGRAIGSNRISRWTSRRSYQSVRQLGAQGVLGVIVLRLSAVASAGSIHLLCGAGRVAFAPYFAGTAIAVVPTMAALSGLGALLRHTLQHPSLWSALAAIGAALLFMAIAYAFRALLIIRQFAPSVSRHRARAEFG